MAKIESYPLAPSPVSGNDKLIGTDTANNNATKNFTVNQLISFIGLNGGFVPYTGATADINLGNRGIFGSVGVFSSLVQASNVNVLGGLLINSSAGTAGQVLVSQGIGNRPIWSSSVVTGAQGIQGPIGPQGVPGPAGPAGLNWQSSWVSGTSYVIDDAVAYGGASWFCILATSGTTTPDLDTTHWALLASQGAQGPAGATGAQGPTGATGATGAPGSTGTQTLQQVLDFDHTLSNARNYQGTLAGLGNAGNNVNAFGESAAQTNTQNNINALGYQAGLSNTGRNLNALGFQAGTSNSGINVNALGINASTSNSGSYVNALGREAGQLNSFNYVNLFGFTASATANNQTVFAGEFFKARLGYGGLTADRLYTFPDKSGTFAMLSDLTGTNWSTLGNSGTNGSVNFIGTTDNVDVVVKRNGIERIRLSTFDSLFSNPITSKGAFPYITSMNAAGTDYIAIGYDTSVYGLSGLLQFKTPTNISNLVTTFLTAPRTWSLPDDSGTLAIQKYTSYVATLTQTGTSAPTATVLENTTGLAVTFFYSNTGRYLCTFSTSLTISKVFILVGSTVDDTVTVRGTFVNTNSVFITTKDITNTFVNNGLSNTTLEVRIYP